MFKIVNSYLKTKNMTSLAFLNIDFKNWKKCFVLNLIFKKNEHENNLQFSENTVLAFW